jgi:hypothetical protein
MILTLFPNNDAVFQDGRAPINTAGTVQSWFQEHEGELQHLLWSAQSPDLNAIEPLWSALEARVKKRFPPSTYLKQFKDVFQEEEYKIPPQIVQNLYESILRKVVAVLSAKGGGQTP